MITEEIVICNCGSYEHQVIFSYEKHLIDEESNLGFEEVCMSTYLTTYKSFWKRLWVGIRYAFGYRSRYGDWDSICFDVNDIDKFEKIVEHLRMIKEKNDESS